MYDEPLLVSQRPEHPGFLIQRSSSGCFVVALRVLEVNVQVIEQRFND